MELIALNLIVISVLLLVIAIVLVFIVFLYVTQAIDISEPIQALFKPRSQKNIDQYNDEYTETTKPLDEFEPDHSKPVRIVFKKENGNDVIEEEQEKDER